MCGRTSCTLPPRRLLAIAGLSLGSASTSAPAPGDSFAESRKTKRNEAGASAASCEGSPSAKRVKQGEETAPAAPSPSASSSSAPSGETKLEAKTAKTEQTEEEQCSTFRTASAASPAGSPPPLQRVSSFASPAAAKGAGPAAPLLPAALLRIRRFNVSPTCTVPIIEESSPGARRLRAAEWSLRLSAQAKGAQNSDEKPKAYSTFNARAEGLAHSPLYRRLIDRHRCVVVVDGFYEWKKPQNPGETKKQPFFIRHKPTVKEVPIPESQTSSADAAPGACDTRKGDDRAAKAEAVAASGACVAPAGELAGALKEGEASLLLAGLFEDDPAAQGDDARDCSATILTMESAGTPMSQIHHRMPVALSPEDAARWLDVAGNRFASIFGEILQHSSAIYKESLEYYPVTARMSNSRYEGPDCVQRLSEEEMRMEKGAPSGKGQPAKSAKAQGMRTLDFFLKPAAEKKRHAILASLSSARNDRGETLLERQAPPGAALPSLRITRTAQEDEAQSPIAWIPLY
ncbi:hypothetical protein BESB_029040 [Besnoitia besnoiti]|uniref:ACR, COG2135 domain-containing protein n=1 Tax=Besnoitia besnoiti TaxID=94643 RepID=A0A2A9M0J0_BESBE|nr:uncharacterized protein BESB_029040 [Besnoitia besnoiti]PFH31469.1 hypothetical protein BESB_029040 [Besnoitia besnoiti]